MKPANDYSYLDAGFDSFLSRSIDNLDQTNLDSQGPQTTQIRYDGSQISGALGDTLQLGKIKLNGSDGNIIISDGQNDRLLLGESPGGF